MGNQHSKTKKEINKSIYDILEIDPHASESDIRKQYKLLLMKYHPNVGKEKDAIRTREIIEAFQKLRDQNFKPILIDIFKIPDFYKYTRDYMQKLSENEFYAEVNDIYLLITKNEQIYNENIKLPKFGDANTKMTHKSLFYTIFRSFKTSIKFNMQNKSNLNDRDFGKEKSKEYNESVRNLTKCVMSVDYRLKRNIYESVAEKVVQSKVKVEKKRVKVKKSVEKYLFYCDACCKGFMSDNTMANHVKSTKHKLMIKELGLEEKTFDEMMEEMKMNKCNNDNVSVDVKIDDEYVVNVQDDVISCESSNSVNIEPEMKEESESIKNVIHQVNNMNIKKKRHKTPRKRREDQGKEMFQSLVCSHCKAEFESRNKLFEHIRSAH